MANSVLITLTAKDEASKVIDNLSSKIEGKLNKSLGGAVLGAKLMSNAISAGMSGIGSLVTGVNDKLKESMKIQQNNISTAGTLMKLIGLNFNDATGFIDDFSKSMSQVASTLPGATSDYVNLGKGIMDNLVPAFKALDGSFDKEGYKKSLEAISRDAGYLAASSGVDTNLTSMGVSKFLGGASTKSLAQLKFFEANPAILSFIEAEAKKLGKDLDKLTARERVDVLQKALKVPDEVIAASTKSISGLTEGFKSTLFDPQTGVFGLMRDLSEKAGNQSAFTALNEALNNVLGDNGLFAVIGKSLSAMGISFGDPMVYLRDGILWFNDKIKFLTDSLKLFGGNGVRLDPAILQNRLGSLTKDLSKLFNDIFNFKGLGSKLSNLVNVGLDNLSKVDFGAIASLFASKFGQLINEALRFFVNIDLSNVASFLVNIIGSTFQGLGSLLLSIDWGLVVLALAKLVEIALVTAFGNAIGLLIAAVTGSIGLLGSAIAAAIVAIGSVVAASWENVVAAAKSFFTYFANQWNAFGKVISDVWTGTVNNIISLFTAIQNKISELLSRIPGINIPQQSAPTVSTSTINPTPTAANGWNVQSVMNAIDKESKVNPNIVIANSSETILNKNQTNDLIQRSRGSSFTIGSINVSSNSSNPKEVANQVMNEIMNQLYKYNQSYA